MPSRIAVGAVLATTLIVGGWTYFILTGSIMTIWPMFGIANQLLACTALCVATTILLREGKRRVYALTTLCPLVFVATTTITAGVQSVLGIYWPQAQLQATRMTGLVNTVVTSLLLACVVAILVGSAARWIGLVRRPQEAQVT